MASVGTPAPSEHQHGPQPPPALRFRVAFFLVAAIVVALVVMVPFAATSLFYDLVTSVAGDVYTVHRKGSAGGSLERDQIHVGIVDIDESRLHVTLRVSGHRVCPTACATDSRIVFFSVGTDEASTAGMPPSAHVDLSSSQAMVSQTIELPVHGHPTLYPFDVYELRLGVGVAEVEKNLSVRPLTREEARGHLAMTVQEALPRENMLMPQSLTPGDGEVDTDPYQLQSVTSLRFFRPVHERVLAILLVVLVAAAAAYAVFMRPLHDLVINSGGLVLGVWGIRSLLTPGTASRTLIDLSLSLVILFLLGAITFRALQFLYCRGSFRRRAAQGAVDLPTKPALVPRPERDDLKSYVEAARGRSRLRSRRTRLAS